MKMQDIIGHSAAKQQLCDSADCGHISHAYIFEGPSGVGRLSLAKAFAERIAGCQRDVNIENNPDIIVVTNELYDSSKKKKSVSIDTIRSMKADVYIKPYMSERKVYIIPKADSMQTPAQNSLLKVFEEPPEYCTIILIVSNSAALLPTILSRATLLRLQPLDVDDVENYLKEKRNIEGERAKSLSIMSGGSIGKALMLSEDEEITALRTEIIGHMVAICESGYKPLYDFIKFLKQNKAAISVILDIMLGWSSDIVQIKIAGDAELVLNTDKKAELSKVCSRITREAAFRFEEIVAKYSLAITRNANYPIAVQCMATEYWEEIHGRNYRSAL